jgi:hypothetical protein
MPRAVLARGLKRLAGQSTTCGLGGPDGFRDPTFSEAYEIAVQDERNTVRAQPVQLLTR